MHPSLRLVERPDELATRADDDLPYDWRTLFAAGGFRARRAARKRLALLKRIDEPLRAMLRPGERVVFLTQGVLNTFWESYFLGLFVYYLNRRAVVLTTERLILMQIDSGRRPRQLRSQVPIGSVERFRGTALGNTLLRLTTGTRFVFVHMPRWDRKALKESIARVRAGAASADRDAGLEHLCPHCFRPVPGHPAGCPECGGTFKSWIRAGRLSLLFPGLGDVYLGHRGYGAIEMVFAGFVWLSVVLALLFPDPELPTTGAEVAASALTVFLVMHCVDAAGTFHVARKGHYPGRAAERGAAVSSAARRP